ncbi:MAG TPA: serine/threonine-protein kinase [Phycisphaerae bacterium]|nr:serine/threonine-protein kinase [Phycisphaerae bacterium]
MADLIPGFRMVATLGQGARSIIYQVVEEGTGAMRALKRVVRRESDDERFIVQVETEYEVSHGIEHPNLRHSYALHRNKKWLQTNEVMLVMDYVPGKTLEQHRPNRLDHFLTIFRRVCRGMAALHQKGFVHADMKPNNIVIGPQGIVKVIDFGQSCPIGHKKERIQGTPDYIAPEQVRRAPLDQRTDVFNLGATMYWVLTGANYPTELPAHLRSGVEVVKSERPLSPKEINDKFPLALSQLIMDCCKTNPKDRPQTMAQVESRLQLVQKLWRSKLDDLRASKRSPAAAAGAAEAVDAAPLQKSPDAPSPAPDTKES